MFSEDPRKKGGGPQDHRGEDVSLPDSLPEVGRAQLEDAEAIVVGAVGSLCFVSAEHGSRHNVYIGSSIWTYRANAHKMRISHDDDRSNPKDMCSLGVVDLDLSLSPDAFGLRAFDNKKLLA